MTISDLTKYQMRRFKDNNKCKICGNEIKNQEFEMLPVKCGRLVNYSFFHTDCLLDKSKSSNQHCFCMVGEDING